ncbi:non-ribosomal peptide synthetase [Xenorhabdus sp. ZM]|uniref:non-ribosomal peptide synthetase n=1 Tax=Xenorhabdus szentirmaii TaxID=290112 RepID=UPI0019930B5A|nr:non-ribosomal peptide synthetase [Xenorhabdus sp. ZM]MBD2806913.1 non-ribosomal peptide synthetase [Xenorhabdus sp. ZM]
MHFIQRFLDIYQNHPESLAVIDNSSEISYRELYERANHLASIITLTGTGNMVGVLMEKSIDYIVSILAIHMSGRIVVPLDSSYPIERLKQMITSIDLSLCLVNQQLNIELAKILNEQTSQLCINELPTLKNSRDDEITINWQNEIPAYVVFTSGTTGRPKPVVVPYQTLSTLISWMGKTHQPNGTTLLYAAQGFDVSFQEIYSTLCYGDKLLIITDEQKKDLHTLIQLISLRSVTRLFLPTSMLIPFVTFGLHATQQLTDLMQIIVAGEQLKITPAIRQWFKSHPRCQLINHYGPSETHVVMEYQLEGEPDSWPDLPPIGQVIPGNIAYLFDEQFQSVSLGTIGQLYIAGQSLALGYHQMKDQTLEKFVIHPKTQQRMYKTGDLCAQNNKGIFEYKGRCDRQFKIRGYRVDLKEIETTVTDSGLVEDCLVVAKQSDMTTLLILYFTAKSNTHDISLTLHSYLAERLPDYMLPSFYKKVTDIPLTQNGKVDIKRLPIIGGIRSQIPLHYVAPQSKLESTLSDLAATCFGLDKIGVNDNFMDVGANSLTLISFLAELRYMLSHDFRQTELFEFPTIRLLCNHYQQLDNNNKKQLSNTIRSSNKRRTRANAIQHIHGKKRG